MGKLLEESDMPPLSLSFHNELRSFETLFERSLENCISGRDTLFDSAAAFEYARSYAVEFYKLYYNFYSQYPD